MGAKHSLVSMHLLSLDLSNLIAKRWKLLVLLFWLTFCFVVVVDKWPDIHKFALRDPDDNLRLMQVRGLLDGQRWFDLRQYRLNFPTGINVHWSRVIDLPIAALIIGLRPFLGNAAAEQWAVAIEPLMPYLVLLLAIALTARRLIEPRAYLLALLALLFADRTTLMFLPERVDHHGWQLALLAVAVTGLADAKGARGGLILGIATALSLAIGLEMMIYLAFLGAATLATWVVNARERDRLQTYALSMSSGTAAGFLAFASYDNRLPVCDALSPVWLSDASVAGALIFALAWISPDNWGKRLALASAACAALGAFHALTWPHCLHRLEGISPEVNRLWLSHVREARPIYVFPRGYVVLALALPITGLFGWGLLAWSRRKNPCELARTIGAATPAILAPLLLLWQNRTGPAAQMTAAVGAAALVWLVMPLTWRCRSKTVAVVTAGSIIIIGSGAGAPLAFDMLASERFKERRAAMPQETECNSMSAMRPIGRQPKGVVFAPIDLAPRLITVTHHDSITGPYHRNGQQIVDVMSAFGGDDEKAHRLITQYHADYVLTCPNPTSRTFGLSLSPNSFFAHLERGPLPRWLVRIELPRNSPFKMWKVLR